MPRIAINEAINKIAKTSGYIHKIGYNKLFTN